MLHFSSWSIVQVQLVHDSHQVCSHDLLPVQVRLCFSVAGSVPESTWCRSKNCSRGALTYSRAGHPTQKYCLSSTCPMLQELHKSYPLFYILGGQCICQFHCSGAVSLSVVHASKDLWDFTLTLCDQFATFPFPGEKDSRWLHAGVHYVRAHRRSSGAIKIADHTHLKSAWLDLPCCLDFVLLQVSCILCTLSCKLSLLHSMCTFL